MIVRDEENWEALVDGRVYSLAGFRLDICCLESLFSLNCLFLIGVYVEE